MVFVKMKKSGVSKMPKWLAKKKIEKAKLTQE